MPPGHKLLLLALDAWHDEDGNASRERTHFFVGNDYCAAVARAAPERFEWAASVHPYRHDAELELERVKRLGARGEVDSIRARYRSRRAALRRLPCGAGAA